MQCDSATASAFSQARFYSWAHRTTWDYVVIHDMEAKRGEETAENLGIWWHGPASSHASAHYGVDRNSIVQYVREKDIAWAAGHTANQHGIHVEIEGYAKETEADWLSDPAMGLAALLVRDLCTRHVLPMTYVDAAGLRAGRRGVTTHVQISLAFHESNHVDPGAGFPMNIFLDLVRGRGV